MGTFTGVDFRELFDRHRRELHVHCYRMLASFDEADDAVQETFLRAWRHRESFEPGTNPRAWLYHIATNSCLDTIRRNARRPPAASSEISWLQPYPDTLLDQVAPPDEQPDAVVVARETIELPYPLVYTGIAAIVPLLDRAFGADAMGDWRLLPTRAIRMPATASYLREPGATDLCAFKLDVVRVVDGKVAEFTTFDAKLFPQFGLPAVLTGL